jgi:hypothetical protein
VEIGPCKFRGGGRRRWRVGYSRQGEEGVGGAAFHVVHYIATNYVMLDVIIENTRKFVCWSIVVST